MAVFGSQVVITMIFITLLSKVGRIFSLGRYLLTSTGLVRYVHPSDDELREVANVSRANPKSNRGSNNYKRAGGFHEGGDNEVFSVPRNIDLQLVKAPVSMLDVVQLRFYDEYQWLIDFSLYAVLVYIFTEAYAFYFPERSANQINLSMVWCVLAAGFAYKLLFSLSSLYFRGDESGERSLVIIMAFVYLFLAMLALVVDEDSLETGLDDAYASFNRSAANFLADHSGLASSGPASKLVLKFCLAVWCASIGAVFTFPGLRLGRMHWDVLHHAEGNGFLNVLLNVSFVSPLLIATMWVKPLGREYLTERTFKGMEEPFLSCPQFETLRIVLILGAILLRFAVMRKYLQSYLNLAYYKMEALKLEAGKITNVDLQKMVARVFYYLCVVALQYVAPMILILSLTLMYNTLGSGGVWQGLWTKSGCQDVHTGSHSEEHNVNLPPVGDSAMAEKFSLAWASLKQVFTTAMFRGLLGFSLWWCCLTWFVSAAIGMMYQSYFAKV